jgi:hypothetical protein
MILWIPRAGLPRSYDKGITLVTLETFVNNLAKKKLLQGDGIFLQGSIRCKLDTN